FKYHLIVSILSYKLPYKFGSKIMLHPVFVLLQVKHKSVIRQVRREGSIIFIGSKHLIHYFFLRKSFKLFPLPIQLLKNKIAHKACLHYHSNTFITMFAFHRPKQIRYYTATAIYGTSFKGFVFKGI